MSERKIVVYPQVPGAKDKNGKDVFLGSVLKLEISGFDECIFGLVHYKEMAYVATDPKDQDLEYNEDGHVQSNMLLSSWLKDGAYVVGHISDENIDEVMKDDLLESDYQHD